MPRKPRYKHHRRYNEGLIRRKPSGAWQAELNVGGKRLRATRATEGQAEAWIDATRAELGQQEAPLDATALREAARAAALLPPGVSLMDAARCWLVHNVRESKSLRQAFEAFKQAKDKAGLRDKSLVTLRSQVGALAGDHPELQVAEVTTDFLEAWLDRRGYGGATRNNYRRDFSTFFAWCKLKKWCRSNPATDILKVKLDDKMPEALSVRQAWRLLRAAERLHPELVPYLALGLFAGIRPEELTRLDWKAITLPPGHGLIHIGPDVAKVRQQRFVNAPPNLKAWLKAYRGEGRVTPYWSKARGEKLRAIREAAGITHWPANALRHSYATYHLALHKDAPATAHEMGNSPAMLYKHYRNLATGAEAARFFALYPRRERKKRGQKVS